MVEAMVCVVQDAMYVFIKKYGMPLYTLNVKMKVHPYILYLTKAIWQTLSMTFSTLHVLFDVYESSPLEEEPIEIVRICGTL